MHLVIGEDFPQSPPLFLKNRILNKMRELFLAVWSENIFIGFIRFLATFWTWQFVVKVLKRTCKEKSGHLTGTLCESNIDCSTYYCMSKYLCMSNSAAALGTAARFLPSDTGHMLLWECAMPSCWKNGTGHPVFLWVKIWLKLFDFLLGLVVKNRIILTVICRYISIRSCSSYAGFRQK